MDIGKKTRKFLVRHLRNVTRLDQAGLGARVVLQAARRTSRHFRVLTTAQHSDHSTVVSELAPSAPFQIAPPARHGDAIPITSGRIAPLAIRKFQNVVACGQSSAVLAGDIIALPDHYSIKADRRVADGRFLIWHGNDQRGILCNDVSTEARQSGISLFGTGTFNWYHWLIEQLPAAFLSEKLGPEYSDVPFVVPEAALQISSFKDSLSLFSDHREVETIGTTPCQFDALYIVDSAVQEPFNMSEGHWPTPGDYGFHPEVMRAYRAAIIDRLKIKTQPQNRRLFLARAHGRRSYNQEEALAIASEMGFEAVYPETMTFREQVQMMHDAAMVIGPSGASFANTLFCQPGTQLLSWLIPEYRGFCSYANLASITGSQIRYLFTPTDRPIGSTREAFSITYELDLNEFKTALEKTVSNRIEA